MPDIVNTVAITAIQAQYTAEYAAQAEARCAEQPPAPAAPLPGELTAAPRGEAKAEVRP